MWSHIRCHLDKCSMATHHVRVQRLLRVLAQGLCQGLVLVHVQGSWPAAGHVQARRVLLVPVLGPCPGQVLAHVQGS